MRVLLQRNLFLGGQRYRRDSYGTEIPDEVDGLKVVLYDKNVSAEDREKVMMLPKDVVLYTKPDRTRSNDLLKNATATRPTALSELTPKPGPVPGQKQVSDSSQFGSKPDTAHKLPGSKEPLAKKFESKDED